MICLISHSPGEWTTEQVMDWLAYLCAPHFRVNGDELNDGRPFALELSAGGSRVSIAEAEGDVRAVWLRRWHAHDNLAPLKVGPTRLGDEMHRYLTRELIAVRKGLEEAWSGAAWLTDGRTFSADKLPMLRAAAAAGLEIPPTLVTNSREHLASFVREHGSVICKPAGEAGSFGTDEGVYLMYTATVDEQLVATLPPTFFPSLFQPCIEKRYELRVFYLAGRCWAMAIFSQADARTRADFRDYNDARPNRRVPFALPETVEACIRTLMRGCGMETGSIDLIRTPNGRYVFLEVNPVGQFGMVSIPCNYRLERHVAEHLIRMEVEHGS